MEILVDFKQDFLETLLNFLEIFKRKFCGVFNKNKSKKTLHTNLQFVPGKFLSYCPSTIGFESVDDDRFDLELILVLQFKVPERARAAYERLEQKQALKPFGAPNGCISAKKYKKFAKFM
jgi:hypothetical protein